MFVTVHIDRQANDEPIVAEALRRDLLTKLPEGTPVVVRVSTTETAGIRRAVMTPDPDPPEPPADLPAA